MSVNTYDKNTEELTEIASKTLVDATPTAGSTRPVSSGGVYNAITGLNIITKFSYNISRSVPSESELQLILTSDDVNNSPTSTVLIEFNESGIHKNSMIYSITSHLYGAGILFGYYGASWYKVKNISGTVTITEF